MTTDHFVSLTKLLFPGLIQSLIVGLVSVVGTVQWLASDMRLMSQKITAMEKTFEKVIIDVYEARKVQMEIVPMRNLQVKNLQEDVMELKNQVRKLEQKR